VDFGHAVVYQGPSCYMCWITHKSLVHHLRITHKPLIDRSQITRGSQDMSCMGSQFVTLEQNPATSNQLLQHAMVPQAVTWCAGMFPISGADFEALSAAISNPSLQHAVMY